MARSAEVLATRWTLIIVRNLLYGCRTFTEIERGAPGIPRALLRDRLRELEGRGVVERRPKAGGRGSEWELTDAGRALQPVCEALARWGAEWLEITPEHVDPYVVLWSMCRIVPEDAWPTGRVVARFEFTDTRPPRFWLLFDGDEAEVCIKPPGFDEDVVVRTDSRTLLDWHLGRVSFGGAMRAGRVQVEGTAAQTRMVARWGGHGGLETAA